MYVFTTFDAVARLIVAQINANILEGEKGLLDDKRIRAARNSETQRVDSVSHINVICNLSIYILTTTDCVARNRKVCCFLYARLFGVGAMQNLDRANDLQADFHG
jgi:hypothetical protein